MLVQCWLFIIQRFLEVPDQLGMAILSVIPENPLLWAFLMQNFTLGIAKISSIPENPLFPNPVLPKTSVSFLYAQFGNKSLSSLHRRQRYFGDLALALRAFNGFNT